MPTDSWKTSVTKLWFAVLKGGAIGAALHAALFALAIFQYTGAEYMGIKDASVEQRLAGMLTDTVIVQQLKILLLHLSTGALIGGAWALWLELFRWGTGHVLRRGWWIAFLVAFVLDTHIYFLWYGMTKYPALFVDRFYNAGPWLSWFQVIPSEWLPLWSYRLLATLVILSVPCLTLMALKRLGGGLLAHRWKLATITLVTLAAAALCWPAWSPGRYDSDFTISTAGETPNILIIGMDSARPDYLETAHGEGFSRLFDKSVVYEQAFTIFPRTFPALVTLVTGQPPHTHGVRHMFPPPSVMERKYKTLGHLLQERGYETGVFSDFAGDIFGRADLGFEHVEVPEFSLRSNARLACWKMHVHLLPYLAATGALKEIPAFGVYERFADPRNLTDRFMRWMSKRDGEKPFFSLLFYSAPHFPYATPYPFYRNRAVDGYSGPHRYCKVGMGQSDQHDSLQKQQIRANYQAGIDAVNSEVQRLLEALDARNALANTIIVVTSDHGENLFEHGRGNSHGEILNGPQSVRIPMTFYVPGRRERLSIDSPVSNLDIAPTLAGLAGLPVPHWMEGKDLSRGGTWVPEGDGVYAETGLLFLDPETRLLEGRSIRFSQLFDMFMVEPFTTELYLNPKYEGDARLAKHRMLVQDGHKLLYIPTRQGPLFECYYIREDPDELNNIYAPSHPVCSGLKTQLFEVLEASREGTILRDLLVPP